jgi:hypothetical protein
LITLAKPPLLRLPIQSKSDASSSGVGGALAGGTEQAIIKAGRARWMWTCGDGKAWADAALVG